MLKLKSKIKIGDNSGYKTVRLITVYKKRKDITARIGDLVLVSSTKEKEAQVKKGKLLKALIINTKAIFSRKIDSTRIKFDVNAAIIVERDKDKFNLVGNRVHLPVPYEVAHLLNKKSRSKVNLVI